MLYHCQNDLSTTEANLPKDTSPHLHIHLKEVPGTWTCGSTRQWCFEGVWGVLVWLFFKLSFDNIVKIYFHIMSMASYLTRESHSFSQGSSGSRKKIKHFSYSPLDKIGKGFSSVVYRGTNDNTSETVAIKAIDMKGVRDAVSREMLDCEIEALTKLKHPNILKCFDVVREASHCYIVTEFCNEGDLSSLLKKRKRMSEGEVMGFMRDIVEGFLEIGENKFLHRDLKLANIFVSNGVAKIADFGFAKKSRSSFEKEKYNVGSPLYMSPEALKKNIYSIKNDIWSIGIMIYEMLHGETPWECRTESELIDKMTKEPVKFKETVAVSKDVKDFIRKCLEIDENRRMGLPDLKDWMSKAVERPKSHSLQEKKLSPPVLNQNKAPIACELSKNVKPLGDATNRISLGEKNRSYSNVCQKAVGEVKNNHSFASKDKENNATGEERRKLSKAVVEKNNTILLIEINKFRLYYKIFEKLKAFAAEDKPLLASLGNNILKRVDIVATILLNADLSKARAKGDELGLKELDLYLREETNVGIKKYKSVIKEYQKKYSSDIELANGVNYNTSELFKRFLTNNVLAKDASRDELLMVYWMLEATQMRAEVKKEELDVIIEGKNVPSREELMAKIKA